MSGTFSDYQVHKWLEECQASWVGLHFDSPLSGGAFASEFQGSGYSRVQCWFTEPSNRVIWSITNLQFLGLSAGIITWVGGWDDKTAGNLIWADRLDNPARVLEGKGWSLAAGKLALSFA